jgi:hypothetical protein
MWDGLTKQGLITTNDTFDEHHSLLVHVQTELETVVYSLIYLDSDWPSAGNQGPRGREVFEAVINLSNAFSLIHSA